MDKLEINDQFAVILFEDKTGGAWCKRVTGAEARLILGMASALNEGELPATSINGATMMKIINIGWLYCENCDDDGMVVKTEKGCGFILYQDDKFVCPRCGGRGEIEIVDDIATAPKPSRIVLDEKIKIHPDLLQQIIDHVSAAAIYSDNNYQREMNVKRALNQYFKGDDDEA